MGNIFQAIYDSAKIHKKFNVKTKIKLRFKFNNHIKHLFVALKYIL